MREEFRPEFRADLSSISHSLVTMAQAVRAAMRRATAALLECDETDGEEVVAADAELDALYRIVEDKVYEVLCERGDLIGIERELFVENPKRDRLEIEDA